MIYLKINVNGCEVYLMFKKLKKETVVSVYKPVELPIENNEDLASELDVISLAKQNARASLPSLEANHPDAHEINFKQIMQSKGFQAAHSVQQAVSDLGNKIASLSASKEVSEVKEMPNEFERKVSTELAPILAEMSSDVKQYNMAEDDLLRFKKKHAIRREAHYPESHILAFGLLLIGLVLESAVNGIIFPMV